MTPVSFHQFHDLTATLWKKEESLWQQQNVLERAVYGVALSVLATLSSLYHCAFAIVCLPFVAVRITDSSCVSREVVKASFFALEALMTPLGMLVNPQWVVEKHHKMFPSTFWERLRGYGWSCIQVAKDHPEVTGIALGVLTYLGDHFACSYRVESREAPVVSAVKKNFSSLHTTALPVLPIDAEKMAPIEESTMAAPSLLAQGVSAFGASGAVLYCWKKIKQRQSWKKIQQVIKKHGLNVGEMQQSFLVRTIQGRSVLFIGDYHQDGRFQRLKRDLIARAVNEEIVLFLEAIPREETAERRELDLCCQQQAKGLVFGLEDDVPRLLVRLCLDLLYLVNKTDSTNPRAHFLYHLFTSETLQKIIWGKRSFLNGCSEATQKLARQCLELYEKVEERPSIMQDSVGTLTNEIRYLLECMEANKAAKDDPCFGQFACGMGRFLEEVSQNPSAYQEQQRKIEIYQHLQKILEKNYFLASDPNFTRLASCVWHLFYAVKPDAPPMQNFLAISPFFIGDYDKTKTWVELLKAFVRAFLEKKQAAFGEDFDNISAIVNNFLNNPKENEEPVKTFTEEMVLKWRSRIAKKNLEETLPHLPQDKTIVAFIPRSGQF